MSYTHIFYERNQGFPQDGEVVVELDDWGDGPAMVLESSSPIHYGLPGTPNYIYCTCKPTYKEPEQDAYCIKVLPEATMEPLCPCLS